MKKPLSFMLFVVLSLSTGILLSWSEPVMYGQYSPVYMERTAMENAVKMEAAQPLRTTGKIYIIRKVYTCK